jgi:PPOX class F420-dependent enzyme/OxyR family protein
MTFTEAERGYLTGQPLGRLATIGPDGGPQVRPLGFRLNPDDTIDLGGPTLSTTQRYRNVLANPLVSFVVDDMTPDDPAEVKPGWGRGVEIRGVAEIRTVDVPPVNAEWFSNQVIRIHPRRILSWHIDPARPDGESRDVPTEAPADQRTARERFEQAYTTGNGPWVIGEPQPAIVELEREGWIRGRVLDVGTGAGEHTIHLTRLGHDVLGIDFAESAIELARTNAEQRGVPARFEVADALRLGVGATDHEVYDTIVDSALFHVFDDESRPRYVRSLHRACRPGGLVLVLALSDTGPGFGPRINRSTITEAFADGWVIEDVRGSQYRGAVTLAEHAEALGQPVGTLVDLPALLARVRRR